MAESSEAKINLSVKTTTTVYDVEVLESATVADVKSKLSEKTSQPVEKHTLIFSGKILKDADTLAQHSIKDGMAIHLVIRQQPAAAAAAAPSTPSQPAQSNPRPTSAPNAAPGGAPNPFGALGGAGMGNPMQMLNNPEMMSQMMNSPIMQSIMSNPQFLRTMFAENPQMQQLMESHPELGHMLNDPEVLRQTMEMMRNPSMFQEMMRNHDQAIRNLQGIPGGEAALQRLYQEVQEPLLNSATSSLAGNPFAALRDNSNNASSRSQNAGVENAEALPNPWGSNANSAAAAAPGAGTGAGAAAGGLGGLGSMGSMLESPAMQSMMQQMMSDPNLVSSMMSPEALGSVQQTISQNPQLIDSIIRNNPMTRDNPELAEQMRAFYPQMIQQAMSNPNMLQTMSNPRVMEGLRMIQQGMDILRTEAPQLMGMMMGPMGGMAGAGGTSSTASTAGTASSDSSAPGAAPMGGINSDQLRAMMQALNMGGAGAGIPANPAGVIGNPEQRFANQLAQLRTMGFENQAENISALIASFGDVNGAIERLLQR